MQALPASAVANALRQGGYVIYFRHASTDFSQNDAQMTGYSDCAHQRLLTDQGRKEAREIGRQIARLKLARGEVIVSPYCRTMETARLMFGQVNARNALREAVAGDFPDLKQLFATPVTLGSNRWIVGHGMPFRTVAGPPQLAEGEAVVIRPEGTGWTVLARVLAQDWAGLR